MDKGEPDVYCPYEEKPWPPADGWVIAWWSEDYGQWCAGRTASSKEEGLDKIAKMRAKNPDMVFRLIKETRSYTPEKD